MRKIFFLLMVMLALPVYGAHSHHSAKALANLSKCMPSYNMSCTLGAGGCSTAQLCSACTELGNSDPSACADKPYAFAGLEGLYGFTEGSCSTLCGNGATVQNARARGDVKSGDEMVIIANQPFSSSAIAQVVSANGEVKFLEVSYDGPRKKPSDVLKAQLDSVAQPITANTLCLKGLSSTTVNSCLSQPSGCGKVFAKKTTRCTACTATASCGSEFYTMFQAMFSVNLCSGC